MPYIFRNSAQQSLSTKKTEPSVSPTGSDRKGHVFGTTPLSKSTTVVVDLNSSWIDQPDRNIEIPTNMYGNINIGHMIDVIKILDKYNIKYVVTSGYRKNAKDTSWHKVGRGLDIVGPTNMSREMFIKQFVGNIELLNDLKTLGYGILNEYIPEIAERTDATDGHLHIGPDKLARENHSVFYNEDMKLFEMW